MSTSAEEAAAAYERDGLFVMRDVLSASELDALRDAAQERLNEVLRARMVRQACCAVRGERLLDRYAEIAIRDGGRCDSRHGMASEPFASFLRPGGPAHSRLVPALRAVLGPEAEVVAIGQLVALPMGVWAELVGDDAAGSEGVLDDSPQEWHTDAHYERDGGQPAAPPGSACTVFLPLCDLTEDNGPTQFVLGSHRDVGCQGEHEDELRAASATTLRAPAGSAVAFDYRLWHRGLRNESDADRTFLYAICGRPLWRDDGCNGLSKGLPSLDCGSASLFGGEVAPAPGFRLGPPADAELGREASAPRRSSRKRRQVEV